MKELLQSEFFITHRETIIKGGVILLIVLASLIVFVFHTGGSDDVQITQEVEQAGTEEQAEEERPEESATIVVVDIAGAVTKPSVVYLDSGARVEDAIKAAGGLTETADISAVNRAAVLVDGQKIYIPSQGEQLPEEQAPSTQSADPAGDAQDTSKININTATSEELQSLKGIGPATADKILQYRAEYGAFGSIEDIKNVSGIGDKTYEGIKDHITV